jgi:hypothetical protein
VEKSITSLHQRRIFDFLLTLEDIKMSKTKANEIETTEATEAVVEKAIVPDNIVLMESGEMLNFGKVGRVISSYEGTVITFKTVTGKTLDLDVTTLPQSILEEAAVYGIREKIKSTLPTTAPADLATKIEKEIAQLKEGKFVTRRSDSETGLDNFLIALALVNATGTVQAEEGKTFAVPSAFLIFPELKPEWKNINDPKIISEVLVFWEGLDKKIKSAQRRNNAFISTQAALIESGAFVV